MFWFTSRDGTRFLAQTPLECAKSLARARFPDANSPGQFPAIHANR